MSNPYTGSVASALRKSQLLLESAAEGAGAQAPALAETALLEGALLHLWRAYRAFLAEQAHQLGLGGAEPESAQALMKLVEAGRKASAEVGELVGLMENPDSWLRSMDYAWRGLWRLSSQASVARGGVPAVQSLIPATELRDPAEDVLSARKITFWHRSLTELVDRQRAQGQEW
ncbi:DUF6586 family protein [Microbulbifer aggregans]|uniref:DUF6586 family protein n=1 Tax=Microbulbifer aggregans TaxID=1769779 RepID=UPI001CFC7C11|nr:DUF6586 family protein [Microbulbifer aggregans]